MARRYEDFSSEYTEHQNIEEGRCFQSFVVALEVEAFQLFSSMLDLSNFATNWLVELPTSSQRLDARNIFRRHEHPD